MIPSIGMNTTSISSQTNIAAMPMATIEEALEVILEIGQQLGQLKLDILLILEKNNNLSLSEIFGVNSSINNLQQIQEMVFKTHPTLAVKLIDRDFELKKLY